MMNTLSKQLPMIPRLTTTAVNAEHLSQDYAGWQLLEVDTNAGEILICKPWAAWEYTKSKNLLILYEGTAAAWLRSRPRT